MTTPSEASRISHEGQTLLEKVGYLKIRRQFMVSYCRVIASVRQFLHAGPLHLAGNMLHLWIFDNNVEE